MRNAICLTLLATVVMGMSACPQAMDERTRILEGAYRDKEGLAPDAPIPADVKTAIREEAAKQLDRDTMSLLRPLAGFAGPYGQLVAEIGGFGLMLWGFIRGKKWRKLAEVGVNTVGKAIEAETLDADTIKAIAIEEQVKAGVRPDMSALVKKLRSRTRR